ncbi:MAG: ABC transporter permease [Deltaproteobacteria bacterium]|nr:ABC transporter permease [Deltaproteobacteria bacterium]
MRFSDLLRVSILQLVRHRRRYWGVMLAIALGTAGFITIITMGRDLKENFNRDLELLGRATVIKVYFEDRPAYQHQWFYDSTVEALRRLPGVGSVSLAVYTHAAKSNHQGQQYRYSLLGVDASYWDVCGFSAQKGKLFNLEVNNVRERAVVLGPELARSLFGSESVVGSKLVVDENLYTVTGVLKDVGLGDLRHFAFIPFTTAQDRIQRISPANRIYLRCLTWDDVEKVALLIPKAIQSSQYAPGIKVEVAWAQVKRVKAVAWWVELFIYSSIIATLILGGAGIWTVMMAAVRSRTREIGLKKAMGAEDQAIMAQFLAEAVCLSFTASLAGSALGLVSVEVTSLLINSHPGQGLFMVCVVLGLLVAVGLGVAAGLYPSLQASRMEVVSAIRYE